MYSNLDRIIWFILVSILSVLILSCVGSAEAEDVEIVSHSEGDLISGLWDLNVTVAGPVAGIRMIVDGGSPIDLVSMSPGGYSTVLNTTTLADGEHSVLVEAYDVNGSKDQVLITLEVDNTPPEIEVDWPQDENIILPFPVNVTFTDIHSNGSSSWVEVINGEGGFFSLEDCSWGFRGIIDIADLDEGNNTLVVVAVDGASNLVRSDVEDLVVRKLPDLTIAEFKFEGTDPQAPGDFDVHVLVRNQGYKDVEQFDMALYIDGEAHARNRVDEKLRVNGSIWVKLQMNVESGGQHIIMVILDPDDSIEETDLGNNIWKDEQRFNENGTCLASMMATMVPLAAGMVIMRGRSTRGNGRSR